MGRDWGTLDGVLAPLIAKLVVSLASVVPAIDIARTIYRLNPDFTRVYDFPSWSYGISWSGIWAFVFLFAVLACTPLQRLIRASWLPAIRRPLGLAAFAYCLLHFLVYFVVGQKLNVYFVYRDAVINSSRPPGWASLLLLVPLALTSTNGAARRLGKRWKQIHRLVYLATALAIVHVYLVDRRRATEYAATRNTVIPFVVLMAARLVRRKKRVRPEAATTTEGAAQPKQLPAAGQPGPTSDTDGT